MATRTTGRATRPKKLNAKQSVAIFRESQIEALAEYDTQRTAIETGVEKAEEAEYHLQQAIKASELAKADAKIKDAYIPTPPTIASDVKYDVVYPQGFKQPATYIRSSATVEDCSGVTYCLDEEDEIGLVKINTRLPSTLAPCTEDQLEEVMNFFEETAHLKQPYAAYIASPVLTLDELKKQIDDTVVASVVSLSQYVYEHWSARREAKSNRPLAPGVKIEWNQETDDSDPYVCFRRRELRQIRKTRNRDAQSADKLRKLRVELENARLILESIREREKMQRQQLEIDQVTYQQRHALRDAKRKVGVKGDEDLLINQKKQKVTHPGMTPNQAALAAQQLRMPTAAHVGQELRTLESVTTAREQEISREIATNIDKHIRWNEGFADKTLAPLMSPDSDDEGYTTAREHFRQAMPVTKYLPTPPASISEEESQDVAMKDGPSEPFRYASPFDDDTIDSQRHSMASFRRRVGRGGRIMIDRRLPRTKRQSCAPGEDDPWKYDSDSDFPDAEPEVQDMTFARISQRAYFIQSARPSENAQILAARRATTEAGPSQSSPSGPLTQATPAPS